MPKRRRRKPHKETRAAGSRLKRRLSIVVVLGVAFLMGAIFLHVSLAQRFEGRLWQLPSRVWSDVLILRLNDRVGIDWLAERLDRAGYGHSETPPRRPGQYRRLAGALEVYQRSFHGAGGQTPATRLRLRFDGGRVVSIEGEGGRAQDVAVFEPERIATLYGARQEEREVVRYDALPKSLIQAVLAAEDGKFFRHHGFDLRGIFRAAGVNLREGKIVQGGSTITQQTVKNLFLDHRRTWWRKAREAVLSVMLDARYSKERILEVYLNDVYLGQRGPVAICGVQAAARFYFGRDVRDLSLAESAMLAGLIRSPGRYNPFAHPERARGRRDDVLAAIGRLRYESAETVGAARAEPIRLASGSGGYASAAYAVDFVRTQVEELYSSEVLRREGLDIHTTLDTRWQQAAEAALVLGLERLDEAVPTVRAQLAQRRLQGAIVVMRPDSGAVVGLVGGRDYAESQFNRAVQARRQPGSCFKPFVYGAGLERSVRGGRHGLTPASLLEDTPLHLRSGGKDWAPENSDGEYRGVVTVRQALEQSLNVPTVRAAQQVGIEEVIDFAHRCGLVSDLGAVPAAALGTEEVTPLELAAAYGTLARMGERVRPWIVREVIDPQGQILARREPDREPAVSRQTAFLVNDMLFGVFERGTARSASALGFEGQAAGKTGTTDDTRDAWFVGYTADLLALVWVGYDDNARTGLSGASGALPIWVDLVGRAGPEVTWERQPRPRGVVRRRIDPETGQLAHQGCPIWVDEWFADGTEPEASCGRHGGRLRRWFQRLRGTGSSVSAASPQ